MLPLTAGAAAQVSAEGIEAFSVPSQDVRMAFVVPGKVAEVAVAQSDRVEAGQLLVRLEDDAERKRLELLKSQSEDKIRIEASRKRLEQARVDYARTQELHERGVATKYELQHAELEKTIQRLSLDLQKFEQAQAKLQYQEEKFKLERMRLTSPFAGRIERIVVEPGQVVNAHDPVLYVVDIDPLWVDVPVPLETLRARNVRVGQPARIAYAGRAATAAGRVIDVGSVADPASDTLTVRVEVPNPHAEPAGQRVFVTFPETAAEAPAGSDRVTEPAADAPASTETSYAARPGAPAAAQPRKRSH